MDKPIISDKFTMEDLYKIREYNSVRWKSMPFEQLKKELSEKADTFEKRIKEIRAARKKND